MLVVVDAVARVEVLAVPIVHVVAVGDGVMAAAGAVDVHVPGVRLMERLELRDHLVHVVRVEVVEMPVVEVIEVVPVRDRGVPAPRVVGVVVVVMGRVGGGSGGTHACIVAQDAPRAVPRAA